MNNSDLATIAATPNTPESELADEEVGARLSIAVEELRSFVEAAGEHGRCLHELAVGRGSSVMLSGLNRVREQLDVLEEILRQAPSRSA